MSRLTKFLRERKAGPRLNLEDRYRELIARLAAGKSFVDVGCLWKVHGAYALHAAATGAARVVGFDINEPTAEFQAANAAAGGRVEFVGGDLLAPDFPAHVGVFDVVFCVSVVQHLPDPIRALLQLRRICGRSAIIGIPTIPERDDLPHAAVYLPFLDDAERQALRPVVGIDGFKPAVDSPFRGDTGYANWFWSVTPSCARAMLRTAGFDVAEAHEYPRYGCYVCTPTTGGLPLEGPGDVRPLRS